MPEKNKTIAVIGDGSWATALIKILTENKLTVNWYVRKKDSIEFIKKHKNNPDYLSNVILDISKINFFNNPAEAIKNSKMIIFVVPSEFLPGIMKTITAEQLQDKFVVSAIKGIIEEKNITICSYFNDFFDVPVQKMCVISGPCHSEEVALNKLSYLTIASQNEKLAKAIAIYFTRPYIKTIISDDIFGTEYATVLKNIMSLGAGICNGLDYGDNFQAVLVSNAIREIKRFTKAVHPISRDINESAYLGDLLVTSYSEFSRNRTFGKLIGKGMSVSQALKSMKMIAEGYHATRCIYEINKEISAEMPITEAVYRILFEKANPAKEIEKLTEKLR
ncbi:MAG: glycerol-3-phosphate dehydrogenase [Bacteroidetes bacterium GWF2_38_335]|nr:MAG: glycerol-3-phosphate dehydrogenase [Bacteroidetes bacterium GWF2_38_335]OFY77952.1 MAG: glycerol-3-phosphate dehydrogenase [Bacteroidetes bacterium RIFOXYA12_FULL_38_20]HBS86693.1 glycerol-3-phosphate dehydrogenase [Bacteroidales bacterium]